MAPRRRSRQTGLTRINAAVDQLSCLGFPKPLIRRTVKNLLKVYGDDGWNLIEEDSYKVVLDVILDEQESEPKQNSLTHGESSQQEKTGNELIIAETNEAAAAINASFEGSNNASLTTHTVAGNDECCKSIITMDKTALPSTSVQDDQLANNIKIQCSENAPLTIPASVVGPTPVNVVACKRKPSNGWISEDDDDDVEETCYKRKPSYGWISDDDDDDDDNDDKKNYFITLTPAR